MHRLAVDEESSRTYNQRPDGGVDVLNGGHYAAKGQWKEARGRAYFLDSPEVGSLKVSFFGPAMAATTSSRWILTTVGHWLLAMITAISGYWSASDSCPQPCWRICCPECARPDSPRMG
jgi:hypothetical protein